MSGPVSPAHPSRGALRSCGKTRDARPVRPASRHSIPRLLLVWLLAGLLPLQALVALALAVNGPAHRHLPAASTRLVLDDFRRAPMRRLSPETHGLAHVHDGGLAERHHHAQADPTVVVDAIDALQTDPTDDLSGGLSLGAFVGLVSVGPRWPADPASLRAEGLPCGQPQSHHPALPERPPRATA